MEKRRSAARAALGAIALFSNAAIACTPAIEGTRAESQHYVVAYRASPEVGKHFSLEVAACAKPGGKPPASLKLDAQMPEHRHGMNYAPSLKQLAPGHWRAEGLMFHMPGKWEFVFFVNGERVASPFVLSEGVPFSAGEKAAILRHGPWPPQARKDPSNRVSGNPAAIALGERLFFEPRLSGTGSVLCATCHAPFRSFQDARQRGFGLEAVERNTPTVIDLGVYHWYGWDGANDSLWSQSIRPLLDPREMRASPSHIGSFIRDHASADYQKAFGRKPPADDEELLVDVGKALAAYQETLVSARTPFDAFRDALEKNDAAAMQRYPIAAQRGLQTFVGKGNCAVCHFGPAFTNSEFADTGIPFFLENRKVDSGRHEGIKKLKASPYNLLGRFNDDPARSTATGTRHVDPQQRNFGEWRVPGLRNVARTAPYMHNGSLATLRDVVQHYSDINEDRLHLDGEKILRKLNLSAGEIDDLVAFLESLSPAQEPAARAK